MTSQLKTYEVVSPEFTEYETIGPDIRVPEPAFHYAEVKASNKADAKVLAVKEWRSKGFFKRLYNYCESDENPFKGLKVYDLAT